MTSNNSYEDYSGFLRLSLLLFELPPIFWLLVQLFLNKYTLTWWIKIYGDISCEGGKRRRERWKWIQRVCEKSTEEETKKGKIEERTEKRSLPFLSGKSILKGNFTRISSWYIFFSLEVARCGDFKRLAWAEAVEFLLWLIYDCQRWSREIMHVWSKKKPQLPAKTHTNTHSRQTSVCDE